MSRIVAFKADDEEEAEIEAYRKARHFKNLPDFARVAVFAYIRQNKPGSHRASNGSNGDSKAGREPPPHILGKSTEEA